MIPVTHGDVSTAARSAARSTPESLGPSREGIVQFSRSAHFSRRAPWKKSEKALSTHSLLRSLTSALCDFRSETRLHVASERVATAAERIFLLPLPPPPLVLLSPRVERRIRLDAFGGGAGTRCSSGFWYWILDRRRRTGPRLKWKQMKLDVMRSCGEGEPVL